MLGKLGDPEETKSEEEAQPMEIPFVESDDQGIYYYWPILPEELCQRWDVDKATRYVRRENAR